jgi:hypothetical protein
MQPGTYLARCESAWLQPKGRSILAVLQYRLVDGKHGGVALRQWLTVSDGGGVISPTSRYAQHCAIALGRPLCNDDPIDDPAAIFAGQNFLVFAGFRKTDRPRGGMASDDNSQRRKDGTDILRVHDILSREGL